MHVTPNTIKENVKDEETNEMKDDTMDHLRRSKVEDSEHHV